mgnify:FL=1
MTAGVILLEPVFSVFHRVTMCPMKREPHSRLDIGPGGKGRESIPVDVFLEEGGRGRNPELGFFRHTRTVGHEGSDRVFQQPGCPRDTLGYARACCHEGL